MGPKIPQGVEDVTKDWLIEVMSEPLGTKDIQVTSLTPITAKDGFLSSVIRATVVSASTTDRELRLFIKITPPAGDAFKVFVSDFDVDVTEIAAFKEWLPKLSQFEMEKTGKSYLKDISPTFYAGDVNMNKEDRGYFIVMEDLIPTFKMTNSSTGFNLKQLKGAVEKMAQLHAVSYAYGQLNHVNFEDVSKSKLPAYLKDKNVLDMLESGLRLAEQDLKSLPEYKHLGDVVKDLSKNFISLFLAKCETNQKFLIHGDLWGNNIMYDANDQECRLFDWQFFSAASPFVDFCTLVYISTTPEDTEAWLDQLFATYHQQVAEICKQFKVPLPFTQEEFENDAKTKGFFTSFAFLTLGYEPMKEMPNMLERYGWCLQKALEHNPSLLDMY